ncbi:hypothetical protein TIFTF001_033599 [Ficus carica]|uniref:Uncharacterized protein n=1 Tax=Ficus carica TaxID=3494 RepID=A0AA88DYJ7_FICCA|nr:hypothetical protein TIFTF001_033599 [Ficus carica]
MAVSSKQILYVHFESIVVQGTGVVEGIFLTLPRDEEIEIDEIKIDPFVNMKNMRLLKICNVKFPESHDYYFSRDLSLLEWHGYPCKSMMSSFQLERLVELIMPNSRLEQLWQKTRRLENLVLINLSYCKELTEMPDFNFIPNLETLILVGCESLAELHPSIGRLEHLALLNLKGCRRLTSLPKSISLESLATLILSDCSNLTEFPEIEGDMTKLSELHLDGTAIKELPTSIKKLSSLRSGILRNMESLKLDDSMDFE